MTIAGNRAQSVGTRFGDRLGFSFPELAASFGTTEKHWRNMAARGQVRTINLGRRVVVPIPEVERILNEGIPSIGSAA